MDWVDVRFAGRLFPFSLLRAVPGHLEHKSVEARVPKKMGSLISSKVRSWKMSKTNDDHVNVDDSPNLKSSPQFDVRFRKKGWPRWNHLNHMNPSQVSYVLLCFSIFHLSDSYESPFIFDQIFPENQGRKGETSLLTSLFLKGEDIRWPWPQTWVTLAATMVEGPCKLFFFREMTTPKKLKTC